MKSERTKRVRAKVWVEREPSTKGTHLVKKGMKNGLGT